MSKKGTLSPKQYKAIKALLETGDITQAAKVADVHRRTVYKWLNDDSDFQDKLNQVEAEALRLLAAQMAGNSGKAASVLMDIVNSETSTNKEKTSAARVYLASLPTAQMLGRVLPKLIELERITNGTKLGL